LFCTNRCCNVTISEIVLTKIQIETKSQNIDPLKKIHYVLFFLLLITIQIQNLTAANELKMQAVFGSNMVIQRGINVPDWGKSELGNLVSIDFAGLQTMATVSGNETWMSRLPQPSERDLQIKIEKK